MKYIPSIMKIPLLLIISSFLILSCAEHSEKKQTKDEIYNEHVPSIKGVWELEMQYAYEDGIMTDSLQVDAASRQVKIFTTSKYMWTRKSTDSLEWHAYGHYSFDGKQLIEQKEYSSRTMSSHSTKVICAIEMKDQSYLQIFIDEQGETFYAEKFTRIE